MATKKKAVKTVTSLKEKREELRQRLRVSTKRLAELNAYLLDPKSKVVGELLDVVMKHGMPDEINEKARRARSLETQLGRLEMAGSPFMADLRWLVEARDRRAFVSVKEYREAVLGPQAAATRFKESHAVTLEVSALQFFEWIRKEAEQAIDRREVMPGRYIRVRSMQDQLAELEPIAVGAAMNVIGASLVETLDTKGIDGSNVHLGGPATITGYFGGIGQPNDHAIRWLDEYLGYYTTFGTRQVLNINSGTIILAYLLSMLGVDIEFKISVYMGNDNPYSILWTLAGAKLFARPDGRCPLVGFNFSNSVDNRTIELSAEVRAALGLEGQVRFEHHIVETAKSIVVQPYDRRAELLEIAGKVKNISAKHEGGDVAVEATREHPSDILDYFICKKDVIEKGLWEPMLRNFLDKHDAVNHTARALTGKGLAFVAAQNLHPRKP